MNCIFMHFSLFSYFYFSISSLQEAPYGLKIFFTLPFLSTRNTMQKELVRSELPVKSQNFHFFVKVEISNFLLEARIELILFASCSSCSKTVLDKFSARSVHPGVVEIGFLDPKNVIFKEKSSKEASRRKNELGFVIFSPFLGGTCVFYKNFQIKPRDKFPDVDFPPPPLT